MAYGKPASPAAALLVIALMLIVLIPACGTNRIAVTPDTPLNPGRTPVAGEMQSGHNLWGYWNCRIPPSLDTIEFYPARAGEFHLNARRFLEDTMCKDCLKLLSVEKDIDNKVITAEVQITHPFAGNPKYTGFDVRGVIISNGSLNFPLLNVRVPDASMGDFTLLNPDGWTRLWNTSQFAPGSSDWPILEYSKGKFATPGTFTGTVNPYIEFTQEPRSCFPAGASITREFKLTLKPGGAVFGYAIDASWVPPTVDPPLDLMTDFPEEANAREPYQVTFFQSEPLQDKAGDGAGAMIRFIDRQQVSDLFPEYTYMECPDLWTGVIQQGTWVEAPNWPLWYPGLSMFGVINETGAPEGSYPAMILIKDMQDDPNLGDVNWRYKLTHVQVQHYDVPAFTGKAVYLAPVGSDPFQDGIPNMFLIDMATLESTQITDYTTMEQSIYEPRINAQQTRMLLPVFSDPNWNGVISIFNMSGTVTNTIVPPADIYLNSADFHPDGEQIVVSGGGEFEGAVNLYTVKYDGTGWTKIATAPASMRQLRYAPDGNRIAMVLDGMSSGIWIYNVSTSEFTQLLNPGYNVEAPSWSPVKIDGHDSIVYQADLDGFFVDVYTINPDTLETQPLIDDENSPMKKHPSYSPDGKAVLYTRHSESLWPNLYVYIIDTEQNWQITADNALADTAAWSWNW